MQKTLHSLASVSFLFFVVLGGLHISTALLISQNVVNSADVLLFNALDLPFVLSALLYGTSQLSLTLENITGNLKLPVAVLGMISLAVFSGVLYLNFAFPDVSLF